MRECIVVENEELVKVVLIYFNLVYSIGIVTRAAQGSKSSKLGGGDSDEAGHGEDWLLLKRALCAGRSFHL